MYIKHKKTWIIIGIVLLLIIIRIVLPYFLEYKINGYLANIEGFHGHVDDVDLSLYRGAYSIENINIYEETENRPDIAFYSAQTMDFSIEWAALFDGGIVGEVIAVNPELNFYTKQDGTVETGEENDWAQTVKNLMPLTINRLEVIDGKIRYVDEFSEPSVDLYFNNLHGTVTNLTNATDLNKKLPSNIVVNSGTIGNGTFHLDGNLNAIKKVPDFDFDISIENVDLVAINNFFEAYANFDVEEGQFDFYSELLLIDGQLDGYIKPLIKNIEILDWQNENESLLGTVYQAIIGLAGELLESRGKKEQIASKVPISGTLDTTKTAIWPAIFSLLKNAFIKPLQAKVDQSFEFKGGVSISGEDLTKEERKAFEKRQKEEEKAEKKKEKEKDGGGFLGL